MSYSPWAKRRKTLYALGLFLIFLSFLIPLVIIWIHEPPTCFDGKQNQGETAVDMGGPCRRLDGRFLDKPKILWSRAMPLRKGYYNAVTYIENNNAIAAAKQLPYRMDFYDSEGVLVARRQGKADIYPSAIFPIFEGAINVKERDVTRVNFVFLASPIWERYTETPMKGLKINNQTLNSTRHSLRLSAKVKNASLDDKSDIYFVATLFDKTGTAIATSRTYLPYIKAGESKDIVFTWPKSTQKPASVDIIPIMRLE